MDDSSSSSCSQSGDHLSQSLPTMEALDLNNNGYHSDIVSDKQPPMAGTAVTNKLSVNYCGNKSGETTGTVEKLTNAKSCNEVASDKLVRNRKKDVMLPGNQETPAEIVEVQKLPDKASLPYADDATDDIGSRHEDGGRHQASSKRPSRKMSRQQRDKEVSHPVRVTRSTSKLMAAQMMTAGNSEVSNKQSDHDGQDVDSLSADDVKCNASGDKIKYNKPRGFHAAGKATNWTRSEIDSIFTDNGAKYNGQYHSGANGDNGNHIVDHILNDSLIPLQDVTNSSGNSDTAVTAATSKPHAQARVYDLVAGKKSKKGKRQQPKKAIQVAHKKKPTTSAGVNTPATKEYSVSSNDNKSVTHVKDTIGLSHCQASGHSGNSRELVREYMCYLYKA